MSNKFTHSREVCAYCRSALPRGIRVALFVNPDADESLFGDFCTVAHAIAAIEALPATTELPSALSLGIRVDRRGHDESALAGIMLEMVRVAIRDAEPPRVTDTDPTHPDPATIN